MVQFIVNGQKRVFDGDPEMPLLWYLRDEIDLTGTKFGCGIAMCGACTVHIDGRPVRSCQTPLAQIENRRVTTIEAVGDDRVGKAVQEAWIDLQVPQCGYCQSGQIMSAVALLNTTAHPSDDEIDAVMSGNICRCATYRRIRAAIQKASQEVQA